MKDEFFGYYRPDFNELWDQATFVFDANVLLDMFRLSSEANQDLLKVLEKLKDMDRLWMPHQFIWEYRENLIKIHHEVDNSYSKNSRDLQTTIDEIYGKLEERLNQFKNQNGYSSSHQLEKVDKLFKEISQDYKKFAKKNRERLRKDPLEDKILSLLKDSYGDAFEKSDREKRVKEWKTKHGTSFSSKDEKKELSDPDGDLVGWLQILEFSMTEEKPIIMTTNDNDWYYKKGSVSCPRPDLRKEIQQLASMDMYIYKTVPFVEYAKDHFKLDISSATIESIRNLPPDYTWFESVGEVPRSSSRFRSVRSKNKFDGSSASVTNQWLHGLHVPSFEVERIRRDLESTYGPINPLSRSEEHKLRTRLMQSPWRFMEHEHEYVPQGPFQVRLIRDGDSGNVHILVDFNGVSEPDGSNA